MSDTWLEMVIRTMVELGGGARYEEIYKKFSEIYPEKVAEVKDYTAHIRGTIESFSSDCERYRKNKSKNKKDLFEKIARGHWKLRLSDKIDLTEDDAGYCEGKELLYLHIRRERNNQVIRKAKEKYFNKHGKYECLLCGFDFKKEYDEDYIEGHHIIPVSTLKEGDKTKIEDILLVCANCHRMLHRKKNWKSVEELRKIIREKE